jgi:hypothetical protein
MGGNIVDMINTTGRRGCGKVNLANFTKGRRSDLAPTKTLAVAENMFVPREGALYPLTLC